MGMVMVMMIKIMMVMDNGDDNDGESNGDSDGGIDDYYGADCGLELLLVVSFFIATFNIHRFHHKTIPALQMVIFREVVIFEPHVKVLVKTRCHFHLVSLTVFK